MELPNLMAAGIIRVVIHTHQEWFDYLAEMAAPVRCCPRTGHNERDRHWSASFLTRSRHYCYYYYWYLLQVLSAASSVIKRKPLILTQIRDGGQHLQGDAQPSHAHVQQD